MTPWQPQSQWGRDMMGWTPEAANANPFSTGLSGSTGTGVDSGFKLGFNMPTFQMGFQGLNALGNLWGAWQSNRLARDQLDFTKRITNTNLNNQIQSYNTALEDRARSRAAVEGQTSAQEQAYVDRNRLTRG